MLILGIWSFGQKSFGQKANLNKQLNLCLNSLGHCEVQPAADIGFRSFDFRTNVCQPNEPVPHPGETDGDGVDVGGVGGLLAADGSE